MSRLVEQDTIKKSYGLGQKLSWAARPSFLRRWMACICSSGESPLTAVRMASTRTCNCDLMTFTLRIRFRFIAYHLSLVDRYPVFDDHGLNQPSPAAA